HRRQHPVHRRGDRHADDEAPLRHSPSQHVVEHRAALLPGPRPLPLLDAPRRSMGTCYKRDPMAKSIQGRRQSLRGAYQKARRVDPRPITGKESAEQLLEHAFGAYVGRQERTAYELMKRSLAENAAVFLTLSGAMTPAGLHQSCLIPLVERGIVSVLTTTGANLYHDAHRIIGHAIREVNPNAGDLQLRLARVIRIYDLGFWREALLDTD